MSRKHLVAVVLFALIAAACAAPPEPVETPVATQLPAPTGYPAPQQQVSQPTATSVYPGPSTGSGVETQEPVQMAESEYQPAPGDDKLKRSTLQLDLESSAIVTMESAPVQVSVILRGSLPDPCHELRIVPSAPNQDKVIDIEVYSLVDPSQACITVIEPFEANVPLGSFPAGTYTVRVNGEILGEFDA